MMQALHVPLEEFLRPFFGPGEKICLRVFDDRKAGTFKGAKLETDLAGLFGLMDTLKRHNGQNRGIYFVVNFGGHEDGEITRINAQFMECDELSLEEQWKQIMGFPLKPSLVVKTRKSLHTYWLIKDGRVDAFRRIQRRLAAKFHGDKACVNESRVLRLPGFYHCKEEPVMVECIHFHPELRYTQEELERYLPQVPDQAGVSGAGCQRGTRQGLSLVLGRCAFLAHCREHAAVLSEHDWYAMITNLAVFEGGEEAVHKLSAPYPGYRAAETAEKIRHFLASGTKPMTCKAIAEKGFSCPKMADGSCTCKAPAALCYLPMALDELRAALKQAEAMASPVENMRAAKGFVKDALYNVEPLDAGTFIDYELREHFKLRAADTRALSSYQKELYKAYDASRERRQADQDGELPAWYEMTERGGLRFLPGLLADHLAETLEAFYAAGSFFFYQGGVYREGVDLVAAAKVREYMISRTVSLQSINDTVGQWKMLIQKPIQEINSNPFILNLQNGLYNALDDSFRAHTPEYYSTVQMKAAYMPGATCPQFVTYLHSMLGEGEICLVQEIFGYLLIPVNKAQKSFVFVGAPNAGKSTLLNVVQEILLGSENVSNIPWQNLGDRFNRAELFGKLANIFADLPSKSIDDNGMFKALTGEDFITAERKNKDPFSFRPYARFLFSCNEIPRNYGDRSEGFYRRLLIIRFEKSVPKSKRDPNLAEKLAAERDGILMWALVGLKRLIASGYVFSETEKTRAELERYRVESNSVLSFAKLFCVRKEDGIAVRDDLFLKYKEYCVNAGMKPVSQTNFNKELEAGCPEIARGRDKLSKRRIWRGISYVEGGVEAD